MKKIDPMQLAMHHKFVGLAKQRRKLYNQLLAILSEIYKSGVWKNYCGDFYEYAGKYGGLSRSAVKTRLWLESKLEGKEALKAAIAEVGVNKVRMVATLATPETDEVFADKVINMSKSAIVEMAKELRSRQGGVRVSEGACVNEGVTVSEWARPNSNTENKPCRAVAKKIKIELDEEMTFIFLKLKQEMEKQTKSQLSHSQAMKKILSEMMVNSSDAEGSGVGAVGAADHFTFARASTGTETQSARKLGTSTETQAPANPSTGTGTEKRYIPAAKKRQVTNKTNGQCAYPNCNKPGEHFHHTDLFSISRNHNSLTLLCKNHHEFAHNGLIEHEQKDANQWRMGMEGAGARIGAGAGTAATEVDEVYRGYRQ